jgi:hypothetical protein
LTSNQLSFSMNVPEYAGAPMSFEPGPHHQNRSATIKPPGIFAKAVAVVATVAIAVVALMFSLVVFSIALAVGVVVWGWLWWKMRGLRKQMENDPRFQEARRQASGGGSDEVLEGIVIREVHEEMDERHPDRR